MAQFIVNNRTGGEDVIEQTGMLQGIPKQPSLVCNVPITQNKMSLLQNGLSLISKQTVS